jgi:ABC-2 type transport system ATP-binding protein
LADRANAEVMALSGGMAQRLQVARSIAHRPVVLFLDEPTSGLDPQSRIALWEVLGALHDEGTTVILTTHYMEEADQLCDRLAVIDHGELLIMGTPDQLKKQVGVETIVRLSLEGDREEAAKALASVAGVDRAEVVGEEVLVYLAEREGPLPAVVQAALAFGLVDLALTEPTLEMVFIQLTGRALRE